MSIPPAGPPTADAGRPPGDDPVVGPDPPGHIGLAICFDGDFPELVPG